MVGATQVWCTNKDDLSLIECFVPECGILDGHQPKMMRIRLKIAVEVLSCVLLNLRRTIAAAYGVTSVSSGFKSRN